MLCYTVKYCKTLASIAQYCSSGYFNLLVAFNYRSVLCNTKSMVIFALDLKVPLEYLLRN